MRPSNKPSPSAPGSTLSDEALQTRKDEIVRCRRAAMNRLARREHPEYELTRKLEHAGFEPGLVAETVAALAQEGLVDDARFVEVFVHGRRRRGKGPLLIQAELRGKGVDTDLVREALAQAPTEWAESAKAARDKKFGPSPPEDFSERARQSRFLAQRGFTAEQIARALQAD